MSAKSGIMVNDYSEVISLIKSLSFPVILVWNEHAIRNSRVYTCSEAQNVLGAVECEREQRPLSLHSLIIYPFIK